MGEMNETTLQQPQMMTAGVVDPNMTMGEQPQVSADQNVVATQNVGLMENDPFQERTTEAPPAIEVATGASIEEPQPIVEQQIAYNVNVDDVFEGGETKADDITKMVNDVVNNNASILSTPQQVPTAPIAPVPQEPVITLEPGPIAPEQVISSSIEPGPIPAPPVAEQPIVQAPPVMQQPVVTDIPAMPVQDPMMAQPQMPVAPTPVMTLEPGPMQNTNPFDGVQTNVEVPQQPLQPQMDFQQAEAAPLIDVAAPVPQVPVQTPEVVQAPAIEQPVAPIEPGPIPAPPVAEQPIVQAPPVMQQPVVTDIPAMPVQDPMMAQPQMPVAPTPVMTLEPGPMQNTNPFDGVQTNVEVPQQPLQPQMDFQQAEAAPLIDVAAPVPQVPVQTPEVVQAPVVEQPVQQPVMEQPVAPVPIVEQPIMPQQPIVEQPVIATPTMPVQPEFQQAEPAPVQGPVVEQTQVIVEQQAVTTPEVAQPQIVEQPIAEVPVQELVQVEQPALSIDEQINQGATETVIDTANLVSPEPQNTNPVPVPVNNPTINPISAQTINATEDNIEEATKTVILQSSPLGKVQPVAPIAVITELIDPPELTQKVEEEKKAEKVEPVVPQPVAEPVSVAEEPEIEEVEEITEPEIEEQPEVKEEKKPEIKKRSSIAQDIDDSDEMDLVIDQINKRSKEDNKTISLKAPSEVQKEITIEEPVVEPVDVEKELFVKVDEIAQPKKRSEKRKIIRGEEKFKSEKKVVPMEEDPLVKFCPSCGIIVSNDDVVCPECGDPIE